LPPSSLTPQPTEVEVAVGYQRAHTEVARQGESLAEIVPSLLSFRRGALHVDVAEKPQDVGAVSLGFMQVGEFEGLLRVRQRLTPAGLCTKTQN
jgi:hypothetical protein